jgi:hypothetical protein
MKKPIDHPLGNPGISFQKGAQKSGECFDLQQRFGKISEFDKAAIRPQFCNSSI